MGTKHSKTNNQKEDKLWMIPIIVVLAIIPFIMRFSQMDSGLGIYSWSPDDAVKIDLFNYFKAIAVITMGVIMVLILGYKFLVKEIETKNLKRMIPLGIYGVFVILSTIVSIDMTRSLKGLFDHFESVYVLIGYIIIAFYAYIMVRKEDDIKLIIKTMSISIAIMCGIGFLQYIGQDLMQMPLIQKMMYPSELWDAYVGKAINLTFGNQVYLTLFNPNYAGIYISMLFPIIFLLGFFGKEKKKKIVILAFSVIMLFILYASSSTAGIMALAIVFLIGIFFLRTYIMKYWKLFLVVIGGALIVIIGVDFATNHKLSKNILADFNSESQVEQQALKKIVTNNEGVEIEYNNNLLYLSYDKDEDGDYKIKILDADKKDISHLYKLEDDTWENGTWEDERYQDIQIGFGTMETLENYVMTVSIQEETWLFYSQGEEGYYAINPYYKLEKMPEVKAIGFQNKGKFANSRGYIWSRTLPLLKDSLLLGSGPETYIIKFPQYDYVGKLNHLSMTNIVVDKPHNMYLQMWVQTGFLSLLSFIAFYLIYMVQSIQLYWHSRFETYKEQMGLAVFLSTLVFMIMGLANDSNVNVSPVFWGLLGLGCAINCLINKSKLKEVK